MIYKYIQFRISYPEDSYVLEFILIIVLLYRETLFLFILHLGSLYFSSILTSVPTGEESKGHLGKGEWV